jgi:hypothetical protein
MATVANLGVDVRSIAHRSRVEGGLVGLLVGDALGVPYEFHAAADLPPREQLDFIAPPDFRRSHASVPWAWAVVRLREQIASDGDTEAIAELEMHIRPDDDAIGRGSGYVVDSLRSARMLLAQGDDYETVVQGRSRSAATPTPPQRSPVDSRGCETGSTGSRCAGARHCAGTIRSWLG